MISFTLIILKDPILLDSIRDFTLQKFSWPAVDKISEYNTDWFSSKVHIDKKIKEIIKVYPVKECYWEELKDTL